LTPAGDEFTIWNTKQLKRLQKEAIPMTTWPTPMPLNGEVPLTSVPAAPNRPALGRIFHFLKIGLIATIAVLVCLYLILHAWIAWKLTYPDVMPLASNPLTAKNLPYVDVSFPSADGRTTVNGWWIPAAGASSQTVVLSHGYGANREEYWVPMYDLAEWLNGLRYNVLMFDYGFADAKRRLPATGGITESQQLLGAIRFARDQGSEELIVWGFSMGAGTALQAALLDAQIDAMILDSLFIPDEDTLRYNLSQTPLQIPHQPTLSLVKWFLPLMSGVRLEQVPSAQLQQTSFDFPIFLIHGTADSKSPGYLAENVANAQSHPDSELWVVENAIHEMIFRMHRQEYVERVSAFLGKVHLLARSAHLA
jgi:alpha-beta hydrolase superfamily lysophospholipase/predicted secreted protein